MRQSVTGDPKACLNNYIYLALQNPTGNFKFAICINSGSPGNGSYNAGTRTLSFPNEFTASDSRVIGHEIFHVYQDRFYKNGIAQYSTGDKIGFSNIEFEQALYNDIAFTTNPPVAMINASLETQRMYIDWINQITAMRTHFPKEYSEIADKYFYFLEKFRESYAGTQYSAPSLPSLKPEALLNVFKNSPCN